MNSRETQNSRQFIRQQSHHVESRQSARRDHKPNVLKMAGGMTVAGLASLLLLSALRSDNKSTNEASQSDRLEAVKDATQVANRVVILKSGAHYRLTPALENGTPSDGQPNNEAGTVPKGKELVVRLPLISSPTDSNTLNRGDWYGFTRPGTNLNKIHSLADRANNTIWVNADELGLEGYARSYPYLAKPKGEDFPARVGSDGGVGLTVTEPFYNTYQNNQGSISTQPVQEYVKSPGQTSLPVATSEMAPAGAYKNQ